MTSLRDVTRDFIARYIDYDPDTGIITYKQVAETTKSDALWNWRNAGKNSLTHCRKDRLLAFGGITDTHARLAFFLMTGRVPNQVKLKDGNKTNLKWTNLREVIATDPTPRVRGLSKGVVGRLLQDGCTMRYYVQIWRGKGVSKHVGRYKTLAEAEEAYKQAVANLAAGRQAKNR